MSEQKKERKILLLACLVIGCSSPLDPQLDSGTIEQDAQGVKDVGVIDSVSPQDANFLDVAKEVSVQEAGPPLNCQPGTSQCLSNQYVETCDATGNWNVSVCSSNICFNGACRVCSPSTAQCSGNNVQVCDSNGSWQTAKTCTTPCYQGACEYSVTFNQVMWIDGSGYGCPIATGCSYTITLPANSIHTFQAPGNLPTYPMWLVNGVEVAHPCSLSYSLVLDQDMYVRYYAPDYSPCQ